MRKRIWMVNVMNNEAGHDWVEMTMQAFEKEIAEAVDGERTKVVALQIVQNRERMRSQRPVSPFEWLHPSTGARYYDDSVEGQFYEIPQGAPPRPTETARLNPVDLTWA